MLRASRSISFACLFCAASVLFAQKPAATSATSADAQKHIAHIEAGLLPPVIVGGEARPTHTIQERMQQLHVPGVSIAVIHNGAIDWARGYGVVSLGGAPVTEETLFQAGSISKPVASMAALKLVEQGKLKLETDINTELKSWKLPDAPVAKGKPVTLRELMTHTGGTTVHGFPGYATDAPVPTLVQVLNGEKPANTPAIRIEAEPGTRWNYSGGGITIMQQAMVDVSGEAFPKLLHDDVLAPLHMTHSTYENPLPAAWNPAAAVPYRADGNPIPGGAHTYPEMAAAGLWTTASDLARFAIELEKSSRGEANHVLSKAMTVQMLTPGMGKWGLGIQIGGKPARPYFTHGGVDEGFEAMLIGYEDGSEGAVVMTNAQGGSRLADEIVRAIAVEYNWPDFQPPVRTAVKVDPKDLEDYVGSYQIAPGFADVITVEGDHLMAQAGKQRKFALKAESSSLFFFPEIDAEIEFVKDETGAVTALVLHQNGTQMTAQRME